MAKTFGVLVALAIILSVTEAALAQPEPDPAPTPAPAPTAPAPASVPSTTTSTEAPQQGKPRPERRRKPAAREAAARSTPTHPTRAEAGTAVVTTTPALASAPPVTLAGSREEAESGLSTIVGLGLILFVVAALLGLAFATIPASVLARISEQLAERRQDIGLALAVTMAASAAIFVFLVAL